MKLIIITLLSLGSIFFFFVGTVGLIRMPDALSRLHATTKCDTLGAGLALIALMVYYGFSIESLKFLVILAFIWITNPTAGHVIGRAVYLKQQRRA
jgi:multicomponent Na+:H+ antiporter subunit G